MAPHLFLPQALEISPTLTLRESPPLSQVINIAITSSLHSSQILGPFPSILCLFSHYSDFLCSFSGSLSSCPGFLFCPCHSPPPLLFVSFLPSLPSLSFLSPSVLSFLLVFLFICLFETKPLYVIPASFELASTPKLLPLQACTTMSSLLIFLVVSVSPSICPSLPVPPYFFSFFLFWTLLWTSLCFLFFFFCSHIF